MAARRRALLFAFVATALRAVVAAAPQPKETVPRRIYTFWHDRSSVPEFVLACLASLAHHNPGWTVHVIHPGDPDAELPPVADPESLTVQQLSDWHRLSTLGRPGGGGVWIDASTIALQPLESWVNMSSPALQAFAAPFDHAIESWAFASPRDSPLMAQWLANFRRALQMGVRDYCATLPDWLVGTMRHKGFLPYLTICAAFAEARHQLPNAPVSLRASQEPGGPTHYIRCAVSSLDVWARRGGEGRGTARRRGARRCSKPPPDTLLLHAAARQLTRRVCHPASLCRPPRPHSVHNGDPKASVAFLFGAEQHTLA
eukprot:591121-Prymnesium_polylepis.1